MLFSKPSVTTIILSLICVAFLAGNPRIEANSLDQTLIAAEQGNTSSQTSNSTTQTNAKIMVFVPYAYKDPMSGMEAFRLLIPKGWKAQGSIKWAAVPAMPAKASFKFYNPNGSEEFNLFPPQDYFWTDNSMFLTTNPPGSYRFGTMVAQPMTVFNALTNVVIPNYKPRIGNPKIIEKTAVPELAALAKGPYTQGVKSSAEAGKVRFQYKQSGRMMEEEMYAAVTQFIISLPGGYLSPPYSINYWYIDYIFSFKAEKGKLDPNSKLFQTMLYSMQLNPRWFAKVINVKEELAQKAIQNIKNMGRISDMIARAGSKLRADQQSAWENRQKIQDKVAQNFSDYIRGVDRYHDPISGKQVELPSGYDNAWVNGLGEYVISESPSYNPNINSNLSWTQMKRAK